VRITNTQIIELEIIITDSGLELELFHKVRKEDSIYYGFKTEYFNFEIKKASDGVYAQRYQSIFSKEYNTVQSHWVEVKSRFSKWCTDIKRDIDSEQKVYIEKPIRNATIGHVMSKVIKKISPKFDLIFNQAFEAERLGLNEICGLGYRKAFEYLIKDYSLRGKPKDESLAIKSMGITEVVGKYVTDPKINIIVRRALWLGNDHAHYLPVWQRKNINHLKGLIYNTMTWIEMKEELVRIERHADKLEKSMPYKNKKS
jgi:hypothetical protein